MPRIRTSTLLALASVTAVLVVSSCRDELGPETPRFLSLALAPQYESEFASLVEVTAVRLTAVRKDFGLIVADTVINVAGQDSVDVGFLVPVVDPSEVFLISMALVGTAADTVFRGGPIEIPATDPALNGTGFITIDLTYVGVGATADSVIVTTVAPTLFTGGNTILQAVAFDGDTAVPGTPVAWTSLDSAHATIPDHTLGQVVAGAQRGNARIVAELLTGPADTTSVLIQPAPASAAAASGDAQSGEVALALGSPVTVQVLGGDGLGVQDAVVRFSGDGSFSPDTGVTDANGDVTVSWILGAVAGPQSGLASVDDNPVAMTVGNSAGGTGSAGTADDGATHVTVALSAMAVAGAATQLAFTAQPTNEAAGDPIPVAVTLLDSLNNVVAQDSATAVTVTLVPGSGTPGASLLGGNLQTALTGVASFAALAVDSVGVGYALEATAPGLAPDTSSAFNIGVGALSNVGLTPGTDTLTAFGDSTLYASTATDSLGNAIPGAMFTWSSSDSTVAIPNALGYAVAIGNGTATITATSGAVTGNATVVVQQVTTTVSVTPTTTTLTSLPDTVQYAASALDANANAIANAVFTWSLSDSSVASINATAEAISLANGVTDVIATNGGVADTVPLTVGQVPTSLVFTPQPASTAAGDTIAMTVEARDGANALVTTFADTVTIALVVNPSGATLNGTASVPAAGGTATFTDLFLTVADTGYVFETTSGALPPDTSNAIDITPNVATELQFTVQPTDAFATDTIAPPVEVTTLDAFGNVATGFTDSVDVAFVANPSGATLLGTTREAAAAGLTTFADLSVNLVGNAFTLEATAPGLIPDTSTAFNISSNLGGGVHWTNAAGGNWSDAASWSTGLVPGPLDTVFIDASGTYTVLLDQNATVTELHVGGGTGTQTLAIAGNTLQVDSLGMVLAGDSVSQTGGTFRGAGEMNVFGALHWGGGVWDDSARTIVHLGATLSVTGNTTKVLSRRDLQLDGAGTMTGAGNLQFQTNASLDIQSTGSFDIQGDGDLNQNVPGTASVQNDGLFRKSGGTTESFVDVPFSNTAAGTIDVQVQAVRLDQGGTIDGTVTIASGATFDVTSVNVVFADGLTTGGAPAGVIRLQSGSVTIGAAGTDLVSLGLFSHTTGTVNGPGTLEITDTYTWVSGAMSGSGTTRVLAGATLAASGSSSKPLDQRLMEVQGSVTWAGAGNLQFQNNAVLDIQAGAIFDLEGNADLSQNVPGSAQILNSGTLVKSGGTTESFIDVPFTNNPGATLDIQAQAVRLDQGGTIDGTVLIAGGTTFDITAVNVLLTDGFTTLGAPSGTVRLQSGSLTIGTVGTDLVTLGTFSQTSGTLNGPGTLDITDTYSWVSGTMGGTGLTRILGGATLAATGTSAKPLDLRRLEIAGAATWANTGNLQFQNNAVLDIRPGGTFDLLDNADMSQNVPGAANVLNNGTLTKSGGTTESFIDVPLFNNPGATLDIQTQAVRLDDGGTIDGTVLIANGATFDVTNGNVNLVDGFTTLGAPNGAVRLQSGVLTVGSSGTDLVTLGLLTQTGGTLAGVGTLEVTDTYAWSAGSTNGTGITRILGSATLVGSGTSTKAIDQRRLEIAGTANWGGTGNLQFQTNAVLDIQTGATFDLQNNADLSQNVPGTANIQNAGTLRKSGGTTESFIDIPLTNTAAATIDVQAQALRLDQGGTIDGTLLIAGGTTFDISSVNVTLANGLTTPGAPGGAVRLLSGTLTIGTAGTDVISLGLFSHSNGTLTGPGTLEISDTHTWTAGSMTGTGVTRILSGATLAGSGASTKPFDQRTLEVAGSATWAGSGNLQFQNNAVLDVQTGGTFDIQGNGDLSPNVPGTANVQNSGTVLKSGGTTESFIGVPFTNNPGATVDVQVIALRLDQGGTIDGTLLIAGGSTFDVSSVNLTLANGLTTAGAPGGTVRLLSGTLTIGTAGTDLISLGLFSHSNGTLTGPGTLEISDTHTWTAGSMTGTGVTRILSGATLAASSASPKPFDQRTLEIVGTVTWAGTGNLQFQNNAVLDIQTGGVFDFQSDADLSQNVPGTANVQNNGTLRKSAGAGFTDINIPFTNNDTIDVQSGTIEPAQTFAHNTGAVLMGNGTLDIGGATVTAFDGNVEPGASAGSLALAGEFRPGGPHTFEAEVEGNIPGPGGHDQFNVTDSVVIAGTLNVSFPGAFLPSPGESYEIITSATGMRGSFTTVNFPSIGATFDTMTTIGGSFFVNVLGANINRWTNLAGGNWSNTANWSLGIVPGATDTAVIDQAGTYTVTLDVGASVDRLLLGGPSGTQTLLALNPLTVGSGGATIGANGFLNHNAGAATVTVSDTLIVDGIYSWTLGTLTGAGLIQVGTTGAFNVLGISARTLDNVDIENAGNLTYSATGAVTVSNGAQVINDVTGVLALTTTASNLNQGGGATGALINNGIIDRSVGTGAFFTDLPLTNNDSIHVASGQLRFNAGGSSPGAIFVDNGGALLLAGTHNVSGPVTGDGTFSSVGGTATFTGPYDLDTTLITSGVANFSGTLPDTAVTNTLIFSSGGIGGSGILHVTTDGQWTGGALIGSGTTRIGPAAQWNIQTAGARTLDTRTLENEGTVVWEPSASGLTIQALNGAEFRNAAGALLDLQANGLIDFNAGAVSVLNNQGVIQRSGVGTLNIDITVNDSNAVNVLSGTLSFDRGGDHTGTANISAGAVIQYAGGTQTIAGPITSAGAVDFLNNVNATLSGTYSSSVTRISNSSVVDFATGSPSTTDTLTQTGGTLTGPDSVVITGEYNWVSGNQNGTGLTRFTSSATVNYTGGVTRTLDQRQLINEGTFNWPGTGTLTVSNGANITNAAGALFNPQDGATIAQGAGLASFVNDGQVTRTGFNNFVINIPFDNNDSVDVANPGGLELRGGGSSPGFYNITTTGTLIFAGAHTLDTVIGPGGFVEFATGAQVVTGAFNAGTTRITGGTIDFSTTDTSRTANLVHQLGDLQGTAPFQITGTGGFLTGGHWRRAAPVRVAPGGSFDFNTAASDLDSTPVVIDGTINVLSGTVTGLNGAQITVRPGGLLDVLGASAILQGVGGASVVNNGTMRRGIGIGTHTMGADFTNGATGLIDIVAGTVAWTGTFDHLAAGMLQGFSIADFTGAAIGTFEGNVNPGQGTFIGLFGYLGNLNPGAASSIDIEIDGLTPGTGGTFHDQLQVTGAVTLGGTLDLTYPGLFNPVAGNQFEVITSTGGITGSFATVNIPLRNGILLDTVTVGNSFFLVGPSTNVNRWIAGNGTWNTAGNWSLNRVPVPTDTVIIDTTGTYTVTLNQAATVSALILGGASGTPTLETTTFAIQVDDTLAINGNGTLAINGFNGDLTGAGTFRIDGTVNWTEGTMTGLGQVTTVGPTGIINVLAGGAKSYQRNITLDGTLNLVSDNLTVGAQSQLNPGATGVIDFQGDFSLVPSGGFPAGTLVSNGTVQKSGGIGVSSIGVPLVSNNVLDVQTGSMEFSNDLTANASVTLPAGTALRFTGGVHQFTGGAALAGGDSILVTANSVTFSDNFAVPRTHVTAGTLTFNGTHAAAIRTTQSGGTINYNTAATIDDIDHSAGSLQGTGTLTVTDSLIWTGGVHGLNAGTTVIPVGAVAAVQPGAVKSYQRTWSIDGVMELQDNVTVGASSTLNVNAGGVLDVQGNVSMTPSGGFPAGTIASAGTIQKSAGVGLSTIGVATANNNLLDVQIGILALSSGGVSIGKFSVQAASTLDLSGGHTISDSVSAANGVVTFSGGTNVLTGEYIALTTTIGGGTAQFNTVDTSRTNSLTLNAGTLSGTSGMTVAAAATWFGSTVTGTGGLHIRGGATLDLSGTTTKTLDGAPITNEGLLLHSGTAQLDLVNSPTITNRTGGVINLLSATEWNFLSGGGGTLNNNGLLVRSGGGLFTLDQTINNTDSIEVSAGGTLRFTQGGTGNGVIAATNGTVEFNGGTYTMADSLFGDGTVLVSNGTATFTGRVDSLGTIASTGGTANWNRTLDTMVVQNISLSSGVLNGTGVFRVKNTGAWTGNGTWGGAGFTHLEPAAVFTVSGTNARVMVNHTMDNDGTFVFTGSASVQLGTGAAFNNRPSGVFDIQSNGTFGYTGTGVASFLNQGVVQRTGGISPFNFDLPFQNDGQITVSTAEIALLRSSTPGVTGRIDVATNTRFTFGGANGAHTVNDTIVGGTISFTGGLADTTFVVSNVFTVDTVNVRAGAVQFNMADTAVAGALEIGLGGVGGHLDGTGVLRVTTDGTWTGGSIGSNLGGTVHFDAGATWTVFSSQNRSFGGHNIENDGAINWTAIGNVTANDGATFLNNAGATLDLQANTSSMLFGAGAPVVFTNLGTVLRTGAGIFGVGIDFNNGNTGVLDIQTGTVDFNGAVSDVAGGLIMGEGEIDVVDAAPVGIFADVEPGTSPGILTWTGAYPQAAGANLIIDVDGTTPGPGAGNHDQLNISGQFLAGGILTVQDSVNYTPTIGDSLVVATFASNVGTFTAINLPVLGGGLTMDTVWTANALSLVVRGPGGNVNQWIGGSDDWSASTANWSQGRLPIATDSVHINLPGTYTVTLDVDATIDALVLGAPSDSQTLHLDPANASTLTITTGGTVNPNGVLTLEGTAANGGITNAGPLLVDGTFNWLGGLIDGGGTTTINSTATWLIAGAATKSLDNYTIENGGTATWVTGQIRGSVNSGGGTIRNLPAGNFDLQGDGPYTFASNPQPIFDNQGTMLRTSSPNVFPMGARFNSSGTLDVQTGSFDLNGGGTWGGSVTLAAGTELVLITGGFGHTFSNGFSATGAGRIRMTTATLSIAPGTATVRYLEMTGGFQDGQGTLVVTDTLDWQGGLLTETGVTRSNGALLIRGGGVKDLNNRTIENAGTATWSAGTIQGVGAAGGGTLANLAGATFQTTASVNFTEVAGALHNFTNAGTLDVQTGTLAFQSNFAHATAANLIGEGVLDLSAATVGALNGDIGPGTSPGVLGLTGPFNQGGTSNLQLEVEGGTPGSGLGFHDQFNVSGAATLGGSAAVAFTSGYTPVLGDRYNVLTFGSSSGAFTNGLTLPGAVGNLTFDDRFYAESLLVGVTMTSNLGVAPDQMSFHALTDSVYVRAGTQLLAVLGANGLRGGLTGLGVGADGIEIHGGQDQLYVGYPSLGQVEVRFGSNRTLDTTVTGFGTAGMGEIAANQSRDSVYVPFTSAVQSFPALGVIDARLRQNVGNIFLGTSGVPVGTAIDEANRRIFVTLNTGWLVRIDEATRTIIDSVAVGPSPMGVAVNPASRQVYVVNSGNLSVSIIDDTQPAVSAVIGTVTGLQVSTPHSIKVDANDQVVVGYQDEPVVTFIDGVGQTILFDFANGTASTSVVEFDPIRGVFFFTNTTAMTLRGTR